MEDNELILLLKQNSKEAFTALYKKYWRQVYNFSRLYLTNQDTAEEVVQEVFIKVWEGRDFMREDDNFKGLMFVITRNLIFNQHPKNLSEYIDMLINELPPRRREIFNLSRKGNKSYKEIAELLNISEKTVENQISEALKYLRKNITLLSLFL